MVRRDKILRRGRKRQKNQFDISLKNKNRTTKNSKNKNKGIFKRVVYSVFVCIFVVMMACVGIGAGMYAAISQEISQMNIQDIELSRSSIVYYTDDDGNSREAATLFNDGNCIWIESNEIAPIMKEAIVCIEDERFYEHNGVDIKRTGGAVIGYVLEKIGLGNKSYGGSTITQQTIKNITNEKDRTVLRKVKEMMRAVAIEKQLSKDEILTLYLNVVFFANNCYGIEAASNMYFDKPASELNIEEAALIAGITQRPSYYDPLKNPENAKTKRNTVLSKMYELGKITQEEYEKAIEKDLGLRGDHRQGKNRVYSYFVDTVISEVIKDLQLQKGYTESFATQQVFGGGLKIYTTMDYDVQSYMEEVFENNSNFPSGAKGAQASMIVLDPKTGGIKGVVGGKGEKLDSRGLNRATQTTRQPGSSIKPLSVYTPAIEKGIINPSTILYDEPIDINGWTPKNSYTGFKGSMTVKKAVEISANIPAVKVLQKVGVGTSFDYVKDKFKLSTIENADRDLSPLALGGLTNGVTVKDMAAAYQAFANDGYYCKPHSYTKVLDEENRVLLEYNERELPERAIESATAYIMSDILYGVVNGPSGTGRIARLDNVTTYGKTGTTNNNYDKWFVGYTPYYVGAVWFGFDQQKSLSSAGVYENISARLWNKVMQKVHDGLPDKQIQLADNLIQAHVCTQSGELAADTCEGVMEYFIKGMEPKKYCSGEHAPVSPTPPRIIDANQNSNTDLSNVQAGDFIPMEGVNPEDYQNRGEVTPMPTQGTLQQTTDDAITLD